MKEDTKKQKWIKTEHDKAVQIHWDNIDRIKKLKDEQSTKIYRIYSYQITQNTLEEENYQDGKHELSIELIQKEQLKHCIEVANLQKQIDKNPFEKSVALMRKNSNEEMLAKKYDKLFPVEPQKKVAQADNKTD